MFPQRPYISNCPLHPTLHPVGSCHAGIFPYNDAPHHPWNHVSRICNESRHLNSRGCGAAPFLLRGTFLPSRFALLFSPFHNSPINFAPVPSNLQFRGGYHLRRSVCGSACRDDSPQGTASPYLLLDNALSQFHRVCRDGHFHVFRVKLSPRVGGVVENVSLFGGANGEKFGAKGNCGETD